MSKIQKPETAERLALFKRGQTSIAPHELVLITDPKDPLFDKRVFLPLTDEAILNIAAVGYVQPVSARLRGNDALVVDGIQRTKRGLVINHVVGQHEYKGGIPAVREAIARLSDATSKIGRRIVELCPKGVKVPLSIHRGEERDAFAAKVSANEFRTDDALVERARKAQQMARHGHDEADIAATFAGVHVQTVKRWLAMDLDKERGPRKPRTKKAKPTAKRVGDVLSQGETWNMTQREQALLEWVLGKRDHGALAKAFPEFGAAK